MSYYLMSPEKINKLKELNSEDGIVIELLGFIEDYEKEIIRLNEGLSEGIRKAYHHADCSLLICFLMNLKTKVND